MIEGDVNDVRDVRRQNERLDDRTIAAEAQRRSLRISHCAAAAKRDDHELEMDQPTPGMRHLDAPYAATLRSEDGPATLQGYRSAPKSMNACLLRTVPLRSKCDSRKMKQVRTRFLIKLRDPKGDETTWGYEQYGRVTSKTNAAGIEVLQK